MDSDMDDIEDDLLCSINLDFPDASNASNHCKQEAIHIPDDFAFPFEPYDIQVDFMKSLYRTLEEEKIGIFESPTGTVSQSHFASLLYQLFSICTTLIPQPRNCRGITVSEWK